MVIAAARYFRFGEVYGVEYDPGLTADAQYNLFEETRTGRISCKWGVECVDATLWDVPTRVNYIFMYNPFEGEPFQQVLDNINESQKQMWRPLTLIYANPVEHDMVVASRFKQINEVPLKNHPATGRALPCIRVYASVPPSWPK
jgi:hypothetical protein